MKKLFTSESVSEGHPDKVCDQISDAILDAFLRGDSDAHVAAETMATTGQVVLAGEVNSNTYVDVPAVVRETIRRIGYTKPEYGFDANSCGILTAIHEQSADINQGVSREEEKMQGAGDQGIMFGYATDETETFMPVEIYLANLIVKTLADIRKEGKLMTYLRPDAKSQVSVEYNNGKPSRIDTIVVSTQHDEFASEKAMQERIQYDVENVLIPMVKGRIIKKEVLNMFNPAIKYYVNPTGKFVIGGPAGDTGLTGRKIIVDTYGGRAAHGGGAFSGKDPSKVDRSAAYAARYIAKNLVANGFANQIQIQLSYAIGVAEPVSIDVKTFGTAKNDMSDWQIAEFISQHFDLTPWGIEQMLHLKNPIYEPTAAYGHFGREPYVENGIQFFPWEVVMSKDELMNHKKYE